MIYMYDCSIRVVCLVEKFCLEIFIQVLHKKIIYNTKKENYGMCPYTVDSGY